MFKDAGINMSELGRRLGVTAQTVKEWNDGKRPIPKKRVTQIKNYILECIDDLEAICSHFYELEDSFDLKPEIPTVYIRPGDGKTIEDALNELDGVGIIKIPNGKYMSTDK